MMMMTMVVVVVVVTGTWAFHGWIVTFCTARGRGMPCVDRYTPEFLVTVPNVHKYHTHPSRATVLYCHMAQMCDELTV